jgi:hypothetical protein
MTTDNDIRYKELLSRPSEWMGNKKLAKLRKEIKEIGICFEEGIMRADWFFPADILSEKIKAASERHEKNYWIVMKRMSTAKQIQKQR